MIGGMTQIIRIMSDAIKCRYQLDLVRSGVEFHMQDLFESTGGLR